jgi:hypothetical protein
MLAVLPHLEIDAVQEELLNGNAETLLGVGDNLPDLILDCMGGTKGKEVLVRYGVEQRLLTIQMH